MDVEVPEEDLTLRCPSRDRRVRGALRRIDERCRRLLELLYYESPRPSYAQIGSFMDMPVGSIGRIAG